MAKKALQTQPNPIDWFLADAGDDSSGLAFLARQIAAKPFDLNSFRAEVVTKLRKFKYERARLTANEESFYEVLDNAQLLGELLRRETLAELSKCLLLKKIVERARQLVDEDKAVDGRPMRKLRKEERQLMKDMIAIEQISQRHDLSREAERFAEKLNRKYWQLAVLLLMSTKYTGLRAELLAGRRQPEAHKGLRDEDLAAKLAIYRTLQQAFRSKMCRNHSLSYIFLCQLAELIWARPDTKTLSNGQALYRAVRRMP